MNSTKSCLAYPNTKSLLSEFLSRTRLPTRPLEDEPDRGGDDELWLWPAAMSLTEEANGVGGGRWCGVRRVKWVCGCTVEASNSNQRVEL